MGWVTWFLIFGGWKIRRSKWLRSSDIFSLKNPFFPFLRFDYLVVGNCAQKSGPSSHFSTEAPQTQSFKSPERQSSKTQKFLARRRFRGSSLNIQNLHRTQALQHSFSLISRISQNRNYIYWAPDAVKFGEIISLQMDSPSSPYFPVKLSYKSNSWSFPLWKHKKKILFNLCSIPWSYVKCKCFFLFTSQHLLVNSTFSSCFK